MEILTHGLIAPGTYERLAARASASSAPTEEEGA
jgi:hypothetical protein